MIEHDCRGAALLRLLLASKEITAKNHTFIRYFIDCHFEWING